MNCIIDMNDKFALPKKNIGYLLIGLGVMVLGFVLLAGGGSDDPQVFDASIFNFRRMYVAPFLIVAGIVLEIVAIMYKGKSK